jgi:sortase A
VLDGTSEGFLSQGAGHVPGTGYPWIPGSNTYVAGHRVGYPGTASDHVFWGLPSLVAGDKIILQDSKDRTYTYRVNETLEVSPTDLSVTEPVVGEDVLTLQTCIEDFGHHWAAGPDWAARYIVRAYRDR